LVESYWPGVNERTLADAVWRPRAAAARFSARVTIDGDEADVRAASEQVGVAFERMLETLRIDGSDA
jgi:hypothetical protein